MVPSAHYRVIHTTPGVTVGEWRCERPDPNPGPEECTTAHEIVFQRCGTYVRHDGRARLVADPTNALFAGPGHAFRVSHPSRVGDQCTVLLLDAGDVESLESLLGKTGHRNGGRFPTGAVGVSAETYALHRRLVRRVSAGGEADPLTSDEELTLLLVGVFEGVRRDAAPGGRRKLTPDQRRGVERAQLYLGEAFRRQVRLADVARAAGYSPYHLTRLFRWVTGVSVQHYLTQLRLRSALDELMEGADNLSRLAFEHGFSSHSHFTTMFRRTFGAPPSAWRTVRPNAPRRLVGRSTRTILQASRPRHC